MKNKKSLGQHWLKNRAILEEIADLALGINDDNLSDGDFYDRKNSLCVEIGPGLGTLTSSLLKRFEKVIAIEYDERLAGNLPKSFPGKSLEVINSDILEYDFAKLEKPYVLVGNIPYYITSPIIEKVLTANVLPERIVLLIQKEVAERITSERETVLSLFVKNRAKIYAGPVVLAQEFTPPPKVDSEVIIMVPLAEPLVDEEVFKLIKKSFLSPRKKIIHNLAGICSKEELIETLNEVGVDSNARPGDLHLEQYATLYNKLMK